MCESASSKLRHSRFRHVFAKSVRRSEWYDTGPGHAIAVAANPKMIALSIDVPAGGVVQVAKLCTMGRGHMQMAKIKDLQGVVCDLKWNPFNDNVLATASHDASVRVWHIDDMLRIRCLRVQRAHSRRVSLIEWHSTVDNALFSAGTDGRVVLWNIESDELVYVIQDCYATWMSLNHNCTELAMSTRNRELLVFNTRDGCKLRSTELVHDGAMPVRVAFSGGDVITNGDIITNNERLVTTGSSRNTRRQIAIHDSKNLDSPLVVIDVDGGSGLLMPIIDNDLNLLYVTGKGDANIRVYELTTESPYANYVNESSGGKAHTAVCALPKRALNITSCEIMRIFRVDATQLVIEPLSFIVPRRADCFQADLFPATRSPTPSLTFREWLAGLDREPVLIELKDCVLNCTNKPVTFLKDPAERTPKLITADINNDRKFRFLSQVTKADYRDVNNREDRDELLKVQLIKEKLAAETAETLDDVVAQHHDTKSETEELSEDKTQKADSERLDETVQELNDRNRELLQTPPHSADEIIQHNHRSLQSPTVSHESAASPMKLPVLSMVHHLAADHSPALSAESGIAFHAPSRTTSSSRVISKDDSASTQHEHSDDNTSAQSCVSEDLIRDLEREIHKYRGRCEHLDEVVKIQQQDIDSLRYEIRWKDGRIEFLQAQLAEMNANHSVSSR